MKEFIPTIDMSIDGWVMGNNSITCHAVDIRYDYEVSAENKKYYNDIFASPDSKKAKNAICLPEPIDKALFNYKLGLEGDPQKITGFDSRMLYFSVTAITTTGFGDIIPLSDQTRWLAGSEAVIGILLIGLFLNAVAWRVARVNP